MIKIAFNCLFLYLSAIQVFGQGGFEAYRDKLSEDDIAITMPAGFKPIESEGMFTVTINPDYMPKYGIQGRSIGWTYPTGIMSDTEECVLLYPTVISNFVGLSNIVEDEIQAYKSDSDFDVASLITIVAKDDMSEYANADTVLIYDMELPNPFLDKYSHCTGVYLQKYAHPALMLKILTDDKGLKKRDQYLKTILNTVRYGNTVTEKGIQNEKRFAVPIKFPHYEKDDIRDKSKDGYIR